MDTTTATTAEASREERVPLERPRRRRLRVAEVLIWLLCLSAMTVVGLAIRDARVAPEHRVLPGIQALMPIFGSDPFDGKSQITLLLVGTDETNNLCDTIILAFIDRETRRIGLLSFPRDLKVTGPGGTSMKINAVVPTVVENGGDMRQGIRALESTLTNTYGVVVDGYAQIDVEAFVEVIDRIGGVEVEVPAGPWGDGLHYDDNYQDLHIHLSPGKQKLMGHDAMGFVRWRKDKRGGSNTGDVGRMARQRELLQAVASQVADKLRQRNLESASIAANLAATAHNHLGTSLSVPQIAAIASMAREVDMAGIDAEQVPVTPGSEGEAFYFYPDPRGTRDRIRQMLAELRTEKPLSAMARIQVLNGCGVPGLASQCGDALAGDEFRVEDVGDLTDEQGGTLFDVENTYLRCGPGFEAAADEVKRSMNLADANVIADLPEDGDFDIRVVLGDDYSQAN
ncbi:MAG: hypothetical protein GF320_13545 [Armatimonadia bacterium]|nr:hypothetical protein [Armatimonadia bacterium]